MASRCSACLSLATALCFGGLRLSAGARIVTDDSDVEVQSATDLCVERLVRSTSYTEDEMDKSILDGVNFTMVHPRISGFAWWERQKDHVFAETDTDRGHADWVVPDGANNSSPRILYTHGGAYEWYSPQDSYRPTTSRLAIATGMPVLAIDYRLAPEFRHPSQLEDALAAFSWIAENGPEGPGKAPKIFLAGDSVGGGLALAVALHLRDMPVVGAQVAAISVVSPETDFTCSGESYTSRRWTGDMNCHHCDPVFTAEDPVAESMPSIEKLMGKQGEPGSHDFRDPSISVLHAELHGLPPTQIHVGDAEVMRSDSVDFAAKAQRAGSNVTVKAWPRMWHVFTQYSDGCGSGVPLKPAWDCIQEQGEFLKSM